MVCAQMGKSRMQGLFVGARHAGEARQQFDRQRAVGLKALKPPLQIGSNANFDEPSDLHEVQMQELLIIQNKSEIVGILHKRTLHHN